MGPISWTRVCAVFTVFAGALCLSGAETATKREKISPPLNLKATLEEDQFTVTWTWDAPENPPNGTNCNLKYESELKGERQQSSLTDRKYIPHDLNDKTCLKVRAVCTNGGRLESNWVERCTFILKGNLQPPVTYFKCVWYSDEPMTCTWHLGKDTHPDTNYTFFYRFNDRTTPCPAYTSEGGVVNGCKFINMKFYSGDKINILITDSAMELGRFYTSLEPRDILQPRPPNITVSKLSIDSVHVVWDDSDYYKKVYEVQIKDTKSDSWTTETIIGQNKYTKNSAHRDSKYTVRVRSRFDDGHGGKVWSDWSTEENIGEDKEKDWTLHYILFITIPFAVATATILLLVYLKRLQVLIFPQIPDPGKVFARLFLEPSEEQQHWIKHDLARFPEIPINEEICSVVLIEKETLPETQHS